MLRLINVAGLSSMIRRQNRLSGSTSKDTEVSADHTKDVVAPSGDRMKPSNEGMITQIKRANTRMQVCVPQNWTDTEVIAYANKTNPSFTKNGWAIRTPEDPAQQGRPVRVQCVERAACVHIVLKC